MHYSHNKLHVGLFPKQFQTLFFQLKKYLTTTSILHQLWRVTVKTHQYRCIVCPYQWYYKTRSQFHAILNKALSFLPMSVFASVWSLNWQIGVSQMQKSRKLRDGKLVLSRVTYANNRWVTILASPPRRHTRGTFKTSLTTHTLIFAFYKYIL